MRLLEVASVGGGNIGFVIQRQANDLDPELWGPDFIAMGKGFVDCETQTIDVWSMAMNTPLPDSPEVSVCPTPIAEESRDAVFACTYDWR